MSMLAEHRRKTKWVINPTKKPLWSTDSNGIKFGKQLMEKMGWSAGKGLGLNEQGIQEPLKVSFKNDTKGMGFKGNDDDWIEHQDEFNSLLNQLRATDDTSVVKTSDEKNEIKSLEEKSRSSKARVHYQKFTRGKDLSKYSENDLACILGTGKTKKEAPKPEIIETDSKTDNHCETSFGVTTINSGSIQDYFKKKWIFDKLKSNNSNGITEVCGSSQSHFNENGFSTQNEPSIVSESEERKSKKRKQKSESEEYLQTEQSKILEYEESENISKAKKKKRKKEYYEEMSSGEEPKTKKRKKNCDFDNDMSQETCDLENKSHTNKDSLKVEISSIEVDFECDEKKKKKKKSKNSSEINGIKDVIPNEEISDINEKISVEADGIKKKNKKKHKKDENEVMEITQYNNQDVSLSKIRNQDFIESCSEVKSTSSKKKKKDKNNCLDLQKLTSSDNTKDPVTEVEKAKKPDSINEKCNSLDIESSNKKKKKKDKKEKLKEKELDQFHHENVNTCLEVTNMEKSTILIEVEVAPDVESVEKKKKKKDKKEKLKKNKSEEETCENHHSEDPITQTCFSDREDTSEKEKIKKKEKKKKKKVEDSITLECEEDTANTESGKKKNKKDKKKKLEENERSDAANEKPPSEVEIPVEQISKGTVLSKNEINGVNTLNTQTEGEKRVEKLKVNLLGNAVLGKYFPQHETSERVQYLLKWANISEFKGSNLKDVEGYGRRKMYEKQSR